MRQKAETSASDLYLRQATRGLWGRKRREVKEELEAHLHDRALAHRIAGLSEAGAIERALAELGRPQEVSVGMTRLYTLPTVVGSGAALVVACALVVAFLQSSSAQSVRTIFDRPTAACAKALELESTLSMHNACEWDGNTTWLNRRELTRTLEAQGVTVSGQSTADLKLTFPGRDTVEITAGEPSDPAHGIKPADPSYVSLWNLVWDLTEQADVKTEVTGWYNPRVQLNGVSIQVGDDARPVPGQEFYQGYMNAIWFEVAAQALHPAQSVYYTSPRDYQFEDFGLSEQVVELIAEPAEVYGVVTVMDKEITTATDPDRQAYNLHVGVDVAQVKTSGAVSLYLPKKSLQFVERFDKNPKPGMTVLVRLTARSSANKRGYEVIAPERVRLKLTQR